MRVIEWLPSVKGGEYVFRWTGRGIPVMSNEVEMKLDTMKTPRILVETTVRNYGGYRFTSGVERPMKTSDKLRSGRSSK